MDDASRTWSSTTAANASFIDHYNQIRSDYYEPYGIVSCVADYIDDSNKGDHVRFARLSETNEELSKPRVINPLSSLTKEQVLDILRNVSEYHLNWTELPQPLFNEKAFGAILIPPQESVPASSEIQQNFTACTLNAGWGTSAVRTDGTEQSLYFSTITGVPSSFPTYTFDQGIAEDETDPNFANFSGYQYP